MKEAWWCLATTSAEEAQKELVRAGTDYMLFANREEFEKIKVFYEEPPPTALAMTGAAYVEAKGRRNL